MRESHAAYIATLSVSQFKTFKKALRVLTRAGMNIDDAIDILMKAGLTYYPERHNVRVVGQ